MNPTEKYQKANIRRWVVQVNRKTQPEILQHLESVENVQGYILNLIRNDMEAKGTPTPSNLPDGLSIERVPDPKPAR